MTRQSNPWYAGIKGRRFFEGTVSFIRCYGCDLPFSDRLLACPDCGAIKDVKKSQDAKIRASKSYLDIVRQNAERAGKDSKVEVQNVKRILKFGNITHHNARELNRKLNAYLGKSKKKVYTKKDQHLLSRVWPEVGMQSDGS